MKRIVLAALLSVGLAGPALASQCPLDMKAIDQALAQSPEISAAELEQVKALRAEGEKLHKGGQHAASVETLAKAKQILGIQ
jgi:hypothetical protein